VRSDDRKPEFLEKTVKASMRGRAPIWVLAFALFMGVYSCYVIVAMIITGAPYTIPGLGSDAPPISQARAPYAFAAMVAVYAIAGIGFIVAPLWQIASRLREALWPKAMPHP
jgi:hypothetical protein